jgi:Stress responsive A/B Barrel Domain
MLRHVALFRFEDGTTTAQVDALTAALRGLPVHVPSIREYTAGPDLGLVEANRFDYGVVATFDDEAGWRLYMDDAEHGRIRTELLTPIVKERAATQFEY